MGKATLGGWPVSDDPSLPPLLQDAEGRSALKLARQGDDIESIAKIVQLENETFEGRNCWGYDRSLNVAAKDGDMVVVDRLLRANADVITPGASRFDPSALEEAAGAGHLEVVKKLMDAEKAIISVDGYYSLAAVEAAVESGQHNEVERLRRAKKMLDYVADNKCKALKVAAGLKDLQIAKLLVESGADVNDKDTDVKHHTALTYAAGAGNLEMVEYLLQLGADISGKGYNTPKKSPLCAAAEGGHIAVVEKLLQEGATIDETKPLHGAAGAGHSNVVRRLLDAGAPVDGDKKHTRKYGDTAPRMNQCEFTALQKAAAGGHLQVVEILLETGADVDVLASDYGRTAVQAAAGSGSIDVVKRLLIAGASVSEPASQGGRTALQAAAECGDLAMVEFLLDAGAQTETNVAYATVPAIALASQEGHLAVFQRLLEHMNTQNSVDTISIRVEALQKSAEKGYPEIVRALLNENTPAIQSKERHSPALLELAARGGDLEVVRLLIDAKADVNATRAPGHTPTPLQIAVENGRLDLTELLLAAGAKVNTDEGQVPSALHTAAEKGTIKMVQVLLDAGADVDAKTYEGETILQAAEKGGNVDIAKLLQVRVAQVAAERAALEEEWDKISAREVPIHDDGSLCKACSKMPLELFETKFYTGRKQTFDLHSSLTALQRSAQSGCPFCVFFWRRLGIKEITLPQPSVVRLYAGMGKEGHMQSQIQEPYPRDIEYARQLFTSFYISVEPFEGKQKPLPGDTSSSETFDQLSSWLYNCDSVHENCRMTAKPSFLPPRLIDVSQSKEQHTVKLINTSELPPEMRVKVRYVTLSHNHKASAIESPTATQGSLQSRYTSIALGDLRLTFTHAIEVTRRLSIQYLWIDQLCIFQDSQEDQELSSINDIYLNSYFTIAASASANDSEGLFRTVDAEKNASVEFESTSSATGETRKVRAMPSQQSWQRMYESSPLSKSAWALHERELSSRVLHFTAFEVLWECRTMKATEGLPMPAENTPEWPNTTPRILDSLENLGKSKVFDLWHEAVTKYTYRAPSSSGETYAVLGSLARLFKEHIPGGYVVGLWEHDFVRSLAWGVACDRSPGNRSAKRQDKFVAPSWSWASVDGPISFNAIKGWTSSTRDSVPQITDPHQKGLIAITNLHLKLAGPDPYGPLSTADLKVSTPMIRGVLGYDASWNNMGNIISLKDSSDQNVLGDMFFDIHAERRSLKIVNCVFLFTTNSQRVKENEELRGLGLALLPVEGKDATYTRIGHIQGLRLKFFEGAKVNDITII